MLKHNKNKHSDASGDELLVPVGIIRPVFHASVLTWFIIYTIIGSIPLVMNY